MKCADIIRSVSNHQPTAATFPPPLETTMTEQSFFPQLPVSFGPITLQLIIPNDVCRYIAFGPTMISLAFYLAHCNFTPGSQVDGFDATIEEIEELLVTATAECTRDPRFIAEAKLKLTMARYSVSVLRVDIMAIKAVTWKSYPRHLKGLMLSMKQCRCEMWDLRLSILCAIEYARQQKYLEDINHNVMTINRSFPAGRATSDVENTLLRMRSPRARRTSYSAYLV
ncbi:hypothetical protein B0H10DRAFT_1378991 [Mycena sp. CBHHK59/15]|nr:hypothetical protein B0H10DRAFT_1378991 [Mycena sp. CBHHK59/15]